MMIRTKKLNKNKGFTLLELMVVLVILGMLAGLVVPNLMENQKEAQEQSTRINIKSIEGAMKMYKLRNNFYPTTEQGLEALVTQTDIEPIPKRFPEEGFFNSVLITGKIDTRRHDAHQNGHNEHHHNQLK